MIVPALLNPDDDVSVAWLPVELPCTLSNCPALTLLVSWLLAPINKNEAGLTAAASISRTTFCSSGVPRIVPPL